MKKSLLILIAALACAFPGRAQEKAPLTLVKTIDVPGARKWDHFGVDLKGNRLFVASEEEPAVEVFDLKTNEHLRSLTDFKEPHNVLPFPEMKKIFVVDGEASEIKVLDYDSYKLVGRIALTIDSDPVAYDPASKYLYVVNGGREAHTPTCLISVVDTVTGKKLADMTLETNRLESMAIEKSSQRLFVNMTGINSIGVVDREKRAVVATWPITAGKENVPLQYDESTHRLFLATRKPSKLVVVNSDNGKEVASLDVADYVDDLAYDAGASSPVCSRAEAGLAAAAQSPLWHSTARTNTKSLPRFRPSRARRPRAMCRNSTSTMSVSRQEKGSPPKSSCTMWRREGVAPAFLFRRASAGAK